MIGAILKRTINVPIVTTVHSDYRLDYLGRPFHRFTYGTINTISLRMFDYHIGVSDAMVQLLISRGFNPQKLFSIYNGVAFPPEKPSLSRGEYLESLGVSYDEDTVVFGIARAFEPRQGHCDADSRLCRCVQKVPQYPPYYRGRRRGAADAGKPGKGNLPGGKRRVCRLGEGHGQLLPCHRRQHADVSFRRLAVCAG